MKAMKEVITRWWRAVNLSWGVKFKGACTWTPGKEFFFKRICMKWEGEREGKTWADCQYLLSLLFPFHSPRGLNLTTNYKAVCLLPSRLHRWRQSLRPLPSAHSLLNLKSCQTSSTVRRMGELRNVWRHIAPRKTNVSATCLLRSKISDYVQNIE